MKPKAWWFVPVVYCIAVAVLMVASNADDKRIRARRAAREAAEACGRLPAVQAAGGEWICVVGFRPDTSSSSASNTTKREAAALSGTKVRGQE